jgi:hypothetical protein
MNEQVRQDIVASGQAMVNVGETVNVHTTSPRTRYTSEEFAGFSNSGALAVLRNASINDRVLYLFRSTPVRAAALIAMMDIDEAVEAAASLDPARVQLIVEHLPLEETETILSYVAEAEHSTVAFGKQWQHLIGPPKGSLHHDQSFEGRVGFRREHEKAIVYWSPDSGSGMISGAIGDNVYGRRKLGYPIGPEQEVTNPDGRIVGTFQRFEGPWQYRTEAVAKLASPYGATVYRSDHGIFTTWCGIGQHYEESGGAPGPFGLPTSNETEVALGPRHDVGCYQTFEGGTFYWSEESHTFSLGKAFHSLFAENGALLGFPVGGQETAPTSSFGTEGVLQRFRGLLDYDESVSQSWPRPGGAVCYSSKHGTWNTFPPLGAVYEQQGGPAGPLGYPMGAAQEDESGVEQQFEGGALCLGRDQDTLMVTGAIHDLWQTLPLGMPTSPQRDLDSGPDCIQFFTHGVIAVINEQATHWRTPDSP